MQTDELASAASAAVPARAKRKRRATPPARLPQKTAVRILDGGAAMAVALHGTYGRGKEMILDGCDWHHIRTTVSDVWLLNANGTRTRWYVRCGATRLAAVAKQHGERPTATLARILTGAGRGEVVIYLDGDAMNLRRANLEVITRAEQMRRRAIAA